MSKQRLSNALMLLSGGGKSSATPQRAHQRHISEYDDPFAEQDEDEESSCSPQPPHAASSAAAASSSSSAVASPAHASASPVAPSSSRPAPSSAPARSGQAHLMEILQSLGKRPWGAVGSFASTPNPRSAPTSSPPPPSSAAAAAASSAFDRMMRDDVSSSIRASYVASMNHCSSSSAADRASLDAFPLEDDSAPNTIEDADSPPLFVESRKKNFAPSSASSATPSTAGARSPNIAPKAAARSVRSSPRRSSSSPAANRDPPPHATLGAAAASPAAQSKPFYPRALSSSFAEAKASSASSPNAATSVRQPTGSSRPAATAAPASSSRPASVSRKPSSTRSSPVPSSSAAAASRLPSARKSAAPAISPVRSTSTDDDRMEDSTSELAATQQMDDDDEHSDDDNEGFTFSADGPVARELAAQAAEKAAKEAERAAQAAKARFRAADIRRREQAEQARLEKKKRKREEEAKLAGQSSASPSTPLAAAAGVVAFALPASKKQSPAKMYAPPKFVAPAIDDPFGDMPTPSPPPPPAASPPPSASKLLPAQPTAASTTAPAMPHALPAHIAVNLGSSRLPLPTPPKRTTPPPSLPVGDAPKLERTHSASELLLQRTANLALKSNSALLLEALLGKSSVELKEAEDAAVTPLQRFALQRKAECAAPADPSSAHVATFASLLAATSGRKLKPKQGEGVGHNAKQRNRARRTDGFLADVTPILERTIEHLLSNGADPNWEDADRNRALWIALQLRGSDRIVQMLLDKGAECVEALESEDESSSDEEGPATGASAAGAPSIRAANDALDRHTEQENTVRSAILGVSAVSVVPFKQTVNPQLNVRALRKAGAHPSLPRTLRDLQAASGGAGDVFNFERGSTVDLAMKLGSQRQTMLLLRAGHLPHRNGRIRLLDFARLHGFGEFATQFLRGHLHAAIRDADENKALDMIRHLDKKALDGRDQTGRTALYVAVEQKDPSLTIVESLLKAGAHPNQPDISMTPMAVFPLCRAAKKSTSVLALLIKFGLDSSVVVSDSGQTLLEFAIDAGSRAESIELLQEAAATKRNRSSGGGSAGGSGSSCGKRASIGSNGSSAASSTTSSPAKGPTQHPSQPIS